MCLAVPGKITRIDGDKALVDYGSEKRTARLIEDGYSKGDYVIVQAGVVVQKVPKQEAIRALELYNKAVN